MYILMVTFYRVLSPVLTPLTLQQEISYKSQLEYVPWAVSKNIESLEKEVEKVKEKYSSIFYSYNIFEIREVQASLKKHLCYCVLWCIIVNIGGDKVLYTTKELAEILKYNEETIRVKIRKGKIKAVKIGGEYRITEEEVERLKKGE